MGSYQLESFSDAQWAAFQNVGRLPGIKEVAIKMSGFTFGVSAILLLIF